MISAGVRVFLWGMAAGVLALLTSCAKVGVPPGGPEDKTGPAVVASVPQSNSVGVPRRMTARLEFSESVNRASVEAALFLSPDPRQRLRYRWQGRALELVYLDSLDADRTYVISVGSQAKDLRGNPAAETFTIAFSTGSQIDRGSIRGWIGDFETPQAVGLWAYRMNDEAPPHPLLEAADYGVQASEDGTFRFEYLKTGTYRVFAVQDRNRDGLWTPPGEPIGIPPWDVSVTDSTVPWLSFQLSRQDTMPARIRTARSVHDGLIAVRANREIASLAGAFIGAESDTVTIRDAYADTSGADSWLIFAERALTDGVWELAANGSDPLGDSWQDTASFEVRARPDTSRPRIHRTIPAAGIPARAAPDSVWIEFSEPIAYRVDSLARFAIAVGDSDTIAVAISQPVPRGLTLHPASPLEEGIRCRALLPGWAIQDNFGNTVSDSMLSVEFFAWPTDSLGALVGRAEPASDGDILFRILTVRERMEAARAIADESGEFRVSRLPATQYLLQAILDRDQDGKCSFGKIRPFEFSEPFWISDDTVTIRARWEYETDISWPETP